jgi:hypothetical protein
VTVIVVSFFESVVRDHSKDHAVAVAASRTDTLTEVLRTPLWRTPLTKGRYGFPFGDFRKVNRAALIHAKQRASQNDHHDLAKAADELLQRLDGRGT